MKNLNLNKTTYFLIFLLFLMNSYVLASVSYNNEPTSAMNSIIVVDNGKLATVRFNNNKPTSFMPLGFFFLKKDISTLKDSYLIDDDGTIYTSDNQGVIYTYKNYKIDSRIRNFGGNYFITRKGQLHIIKSDGNIVYYDGIDGDNIRRTSLEGGNFFITSRSKNMYITTSNGFFTKVDYDNLGFRVRDIVKVGSNYLVTKDGQVFTTGEKVSFNDQGTKIIEGVLYKVLEPLRYEVEIKGGNYFFDESFNIYTVSNSGIFNQAQESKEIQIKSHEGERPYIIGPDYFTYLNQDTYFVDANGKVVGPVNLDFRPMLLN